MTLQGFHTTRQRVARYFDETARDRWSELTSDAPVSRIRETVRAGRDAMRATLLSWLPEDLSGRRLLDAGCGPGQLAMAAAERGADVVAVDVAQSLVDIGRMRAAEALDAETRARIDFRAGDMLDPGFGAFDHVASMDVLIHYAPADALTALARLAERCSGSILFTFAPRTPALSVMHAAGKLFPQSDRSPRIAPVSPARMAALIERDERLASWRVGRDARISRGFYISHAMELVKR